MFVYLFVWETLSIPETPETPAGAPETPAGAPQGD